MSASQTVPVYLPLRYVTLTWSFSRNFSHCSIGAELNSTAVVAHADFHDPLFVIGRPFVFDFVALFRRRDVVLPYYDCFAAFLLAAAKASDQ